MSTVRELHPPRADEELLATIDRFREEAKAGRLIGFAWIAITAESTGYESAGDRMRLLGGVSCLENQINKALDAR